MNFYKRYTGDYARDTVHLSMVEDGAYNRLMDFYYSTEKPLPIDRKSVYRIARATEKAEQKAVDSILSQFFQECATGYRHKRIEVEIEKAKPKAGANRENGKKGGRPRKMQPTDNPPENPLGFSGETQAEPTEKPALVNHSHNHSQKNKSYSGGVGSSSVVGAVDNSNSPPLSADEIGKHLVQLEVQRDKVLRLNPRAYEALHRLADRKVGLPVLLRAHALACVRRTADGDSSPVNPAFLESFIDEAKVERQQGTATAPGWDGTTEGVRAKAAELGLPSQRADEQWFWYRLLVIKAAGDRHLIDREVSRAERMNPNEHERVYRFFHEAALGKEAA
ncbi:YdaU family protein [Cupriavidus sp. KB_39]|uniref:YdaU family protein n=1 Tax=Cupriavidus sp. KB_39 TaxID=3233036 RepID=UPI003F8F3C96